MIPKAWAGDRIILRFDAIHAGTRYWLNGQELGYSENLFTPVEWDITDAARPGQTNRLDLEMKVATVSEALSYSSAYAFHNLGGIDRSVRVFALPPTHVREMHLDAALDKDYRDGEVRLHLLLESGADPGGRASSRAQTCPEVTAREDARPPEPLSLVLKLQDPAGKVVKALAARAAAIGARSPARKPLTSSRMSPRRCSGARRSPSSTG